MRARFFFCAGEVKLPPFFSERERGGIGRRRRRRKRDFFFFSGGAAAGRRVGGQLFALFAIGERERERNKKT